MHHPTKPLLLTCAQIQLLSFINSGFFSVLHNPSFFCPLCNFRPLALSASSFLYSASNNPAAAHTPSHLPASQLCILPHFPACPTLLLSSCHLPSDGIIPVILSHYRSSDANGCTANPAAGKPGRAPIPASAPALKQLCFAQSCQ